MICYIWQNERLRFEGSSNRTYLSLKIKLFIITFSVVKDKLNYNVVLIRFCKIAKLAEEPPSLEAPTAA